ncbi:scavenger receptor cysteine-rich type 1 protein M130-like [Saccostrea cucullata]|uniref:scavenger receptor cysteine-rich type 1 protein M130-like n=1 Tax=Saccostrea cuccullata TaxID=36930 RepID=UPI002ED31DC1
MDVMLYVCLVIFGVISSSSQQLIYQGRSEETNEHVDSYFKVFFQFKTEVLNRLSSIESEMEKNFQTMKSFNELLQKEMSRVDKEMSKFKEEVRNEVTGHLNKTLQKIENITNRIGVLESETVAQHSFRINTLMGDVSALRTSLRNIKQSASGHTSRLSAIETQQRSQGTSLTVLSNGLKSFIEVRITDGGSSYGRVEVFYDGSWGTICDDDWDNNDARVVCRMLGRSGGTAVDEASYGEGSGQIWLDDVNCSGTESSLMECSKPPFGSHNCGHGEDAGVSCN